LHVHVHALSVYDGRLWIGGNFSRVSGTGPTQGQIVFAQGWASHALNPAGDGLAQVQPAGWASVGAGLSASVLAMAPTPQGLMAAGSFMPLHGGPARVLLRWQNGQIHGLEHALWIDPQDQMSALPSRIDALSRYGELLCAGGEFSHTTAAVGVSNVACTNLLSGLDLYPEQGVNETVHALDSFWWLLVDGS
jgi:hypothetical protein